jgi:Fe-S-cluster containining protein
MKFECDICGKGFIIRNKNDYLEALKHMGEHPPNEIIENEKKKEWERAKIQEEILSFFKCYRCGYCCRNIPVQLREEEIKSISAYLGISEQEFVKRYVDKSKLPFLYLKTPCPFFEFYRCTIYPVRPAVCRIFPFNEESLCLLQRIDNIYCPLARDIAREYRIFFKVKYKKPTPIPKWFRKLTHRIFQEREKIISSLRNEEYTPDSFFMPINFNALVNFLNWLKKYGRFYGNEANSSMPTLRWNSGNNE